MTQLSFDLSLKAKIGDRKVIASVSGGKDSGDQRHGREPL